MSFFLMAAKRAGGAAASVATASLALVDDTSTPVTFAVNELRGTFPDGSLRALGVQFSASLADGVAKSYTATITGRNGSDTVSCDVWRFDGNTGTVKVTGSIPLKPGRVMAGDITGATWQEVVYDSGSATAAGMQNKAVIAAMGSRYLCDTFIALTPLQPESSDVAGDSKTFYQTDTATSQTLGWVVDTVQAVEAYWAHGIATYEHVHGLWCAYIRADSGAKKRAYFQRAYLTLYSQMGNDADTGGGRTRIGSANGSYSTVYGGVDASLPAASSTSVAGLLGEQNSGIHLGWILGYWLTGWKQPWRRIAHLQSAEGGEYVRSYADAKAVMVNDTTRFNMSRRIMSLQAGYIAHATLQVPGGYGSGRDNTVDDYVAQFGWILDALEEYMYTTANFGSFINGVVGQRPTHVDLAGAGEFPTFQTMVTAKVLISHYHNVENDSRIPTFVVALADYCITQMYSDTGIYALPYYPSVPPSSGWTAASSGGGSTGGIKGYDDWYYPPILAEIFGFAFAVTGNTTYKTYAELCARRVQLIDVPGPNGDFIHSTKSIGEYFAGHLQSAKYYIDGGAVRPVSGAHPTAIVNPPTYTS